MELGIIVLGHLKITLYITIPQTNIPRSYETKQEVEERKRGKEKYKTNQITFCAVRYSFSELQGMLTLFLLKFQLHLITCSARKKLLYQGKICTKLPNSLTCKGRYQSKGYVRSQIYTNYAS